MAVHFFAFDRNLFLSTRQANITGYKYLENTIKSYYFKKCIDYLLKRAIIILKLKNIKRRCLLKGDGGFLWKWAYFHK